MASWPLRSVSTIWTTAYACSAEKPDISPKNAWSLWPWKPEPMLPSWSWKHPLLRRQKKIEQPPKSCTPQGLCLIHLCTNYHHPQCLHHHSWCSHYPGHLQVDSQYTINVPRGLRILRLVHWCGNHGEAPSCCVYHTCYQTLSYWLHLYLYIHSGNYINCTYTFHLVRSNTWISTSPLGLELHLELGYHWLTQYNPSIDWVHSHIIFHMNITAESPPVQKLEAPATVKPDPVSRYGFLQEIQVKSKRKFVSWVSKSQSEILWMRENGSESLCIKVGEAQRCHRWVKLCDIWLELWPSRMYALIVGKMFQGMERWLLGCNQQVG